MDHAKMRVQAQNNLYQLMRWQRIKDVGVIFKMYLGCSSRSADLYFIEK